MNERRPRFTKEEAEKYIEEVFQHYGDPIRITEDQFIDYFDEEIFYLKL